MVRVLAGSAMGERVWDRVAAESPVHSPHVNVTVLDIYLEPGTTYKHHTAPGHTTLIVFMISGVAATRACPPHSLASARPLSLRRPRPLKFA